MLDINYEVSESTDDEANDISNEIMNFNQSKVPFTQKETPIFKRYVVKYQGTIIAGINAVLYHWGILYIDELFVADKYRHKKIGSYLINRVEQEAIACGASLSHLDTFDFQAKDFYLKQGYEIFGELKDCPPGHTRYYLRKKFEKIPS